MSAAKKTEPRAAADDIDELSKAGAAAAPTQFAWACFRLGLTILSELRLLRAGVRP